MKIFNFPITVGLARVRILVQLMMRYVSDTYFLLVQIAKVWQALRYFHLALAIASSPDDTTLKVVMATFQKDLPNMKIYLAFILLSSEASGTSF